MSQDCSSAIKENKKISGIQIAHSAQLTVVVRGSYNYAINFFTNEKGIFARMTSVGGIEFNQDDQVVFIDDKGQERSYKFIGMANWLRVPFQPTATTCCSTWMQYNGLQKAI